MRKLGILIGIIAAATLGFTGTASAQEQIQGPLCDEVLGGIAEGAADSGIKHTTAGAQESCNESFEKFQLRPSPVLCGVAADLKETPLADAAALPEGINDGLAGLPENPVVGAVSPCPTDTPPPGDTDGNGNGGGGGGGGAEVQAANAAADGGLPRTGGELFAGAGFGLASLGALIRRFLA